MICSLRSMTLFLCCLVKFNREVVELYENSHRCYHFNYRYYYFISSLFLNTVFLIFVHLMSGNLFLIIMLYYL